MALLRMVVFSAEYSPGFSPVGAEFIKPVATSIIEVSMDFSFISASLSVLITFLAFEMTIAAGVCVSFDSSNAASASLICNIAVGCPA